MLQKQQHVESCCCLKQATEISSLCNR